MEYEKKLKYARFQKQNDIYTWSDEYDINEPCEDFSEYSEDDYDTFLPPLSYCLLRTETKETLEKMLQEQYQSNIAPEIPNGAIVLSKDGIPIEMYWIEYQLTIDT